MRFLFIRHGEPDYTHDCLTETGRAQAAAAADRLAGEGITVNCIAKSGIVNDHAPRSPKNFDVATVADRIPVGVVGTTENYGALVSYIVSEEANFITGQVFNLSGGLHIG